MDLNIIRLITNDTLTKASFQKLQRLFFIIELQHFILHGKKLKKAIFVKSHEHIKFLLKQIRLIWKKTNQVTPDDVVAGVVEVDVLSAAKVDDLNERLLLDAVNLKHGATRDHDL